MYDHLCEGRSLQFQINGLKKKFETLKLETFMYQNPNSYRD